jgi:outer membrane receptor protein involved in Fe transport
MTLVKNRYAIALMLTAAQAVAQADDEDGGANPAEALEKQQVEVVGTTPLPGLGTPLRDVPANVQVIGGKDLQRQRQQNLPDFLERNPTSVTVNAAQGNPYQTDISFRGFTASPLLGTPQGLSVFQDGVRVNEPFGDIVDWDLLPQSAISSIQVIPGSNPIFGLNTLGGALAIYTKSGSENPGTSLELSGGSFGRKTLEFEHGGYQGHWDWFVTTNLSKDDGWAQHDPSRVEQFFAKVGYQTEQSDLDVSLTAANNRLEGTQTLPASWLDTPRQAYTWPDTDRNRLTMLTIKGSHFLDKEWLLGGNAYVRHGLILGQSSDVNDDYGETDPETGMIDTVQALDDRTDVDQTTYGGGLQLTATSPLAGHGNSLVFGFNGDFGRAKFTQYAQPARFNATRGADGIGDYDLEVAADTTDRTLAAYLMDTFKATPDVAVTLAGRYNDAATTIRDASGLSPDLDGSHAFRRFTPGIGAAWNPRDNLTAYTSYNEGMRAPTAVELTCADPDAPCKLPNSFVSDPALKAVVARTFELGARGKAGAWSWSAAAYRTRSSDDIQFVASGNSVNAGYFRNVGSTRRQGVELSASGPLGPLQLTVRYSYIDATYVDGFVENSPNNSSADADGNIVVTPGSRIPSIPRNALHVRLDADVRADWQVGANVVYNGPTFARGDENNRAAGGVVPGYATLDLDTTWTISKRVQLFARADNVFDRHYSNFGILAENDFPGAARTFDPDNARSETFLGQGAPFGVWAGVRLHWE